MMHRNRRWVVNSVATMEELADMLTQRTWTLCSGFCVEGHGGYLFLNDATSEDGAGEYAVIRGTVGDSTWLQVESITFSWCDHETALSYIRRTLSGEFDESDFACAVNLAGRLDLPASHGRCHLCA